MTTTPAPKRHTGSLHRYGGGSRLSEAYTFGRDGKSCPMRFRIKTSATFTAWKRGRDERRALLAPVTP